MKKIPTLFERRYENHRVVEVLPNVTPGMEWVLEGEGFNVTFTEVCREARRNEGDMMAAWYDREGAVKDGLL